MDFLRDELPSQEFNTWIRPLQVEGDQAELRLYAPNRFVLDWVNDKYLNRIQELLDDLSQGQAPLLSLFIGSRRSTVPAAVAAPSVAAAPIQRSEPEPVPVATPVPAPRPQSGHGFQPEPVNYGKVEENEPYTEKQKKFLIVIL